MHAASLAVLQRFYQALQRGDGEAMAACYHPQARFQDTAFGTLQRAEVGDMRRMLSGRAGGLPAGELDAGIAGAGHPVQADDPGQQQQRE